MQFPVGAPERIVELTGDEVTIGRGSRRLGIDPTIDLGGPPADGGVSHDHAALLRRPDDTWALVDRGSTNGTYVNDAVEPLPVGSPVALRDGDRFHIGVWTQIVIRRQDES